MKKVLLVLAILLIPFSVDAATGKLTCDKNSVIIKDIINCELEVTTADPLTGINGTIDYKVESLNLTSITALNGWKSTSSSNIALTKEVGDEETGPTGTFKIAKLTFKVKDTPSFGNNSIDITSTNFTNNPTANIKIVSNNNKLSKINIQGYSFGFNSNQNTYNLTINEETVTINATLADNRASFVEGYGPRTVSLKYGSNPINIMVLSENGETNIYTLNITRNDNRSTDNYLSSLSVNDVTLNPIFNKNTLTYDASVPMATESVTISAKLSNSKASFTTNLGPRDVKLNIGENSVLIQVKSESGALRTYTINIIRSSESSNNYLKSISLSSGTIAFDKNINEYKINVLNDITDITVDAEALDEKAKVTISGGKNLVVGENIIEIKVVAENKSERTYKIIVTRLDAGEILSSNNTLKNIYIVNYDFNFNSSITTYSLKIGNEKSLDITATPEDESAIVKITGNEKLKNGSTITITVTSEDGNSKIYTINIEKTNKTLFIILGILGFILLAVIIFLIINRKKIFKKQDHTLDESLKLNRSENERIVIEQKTKAYEPLINKDDISFEEK